MMSKFALSIVIVLMFASPRANSATAEPPRDAKASDDLLEVSLIQLLATPERFAGKTVRVIGYYVCERENEAIYLNPGDRKAAIHINSVRVSPPENQSCKKSLRNRYVILEGIFTPGKQQMSDVRSEIDNMTRFEVWQ